MDPKKRRTYTEQERKEVLSTVKKKGVCGAAKQHGVSQSNVSKWATKAGVKRESAELPDREMEAEPQRPVSPRRNEPREPEQTPLEPPISLAAPSSGKVPVASPQDKRAQPPRQQSDGWPRATRRRRRR